MGAVIVHVEDQEDLGYQKVQLLLINDQKKNASKFYKIEYFIHTACSLPHPYAKSSLLHDLIVIFCTFKPLLVVPNLMNRHVQ